MKVLAHILALICLGFSGCNQQSEAVRHVAKKVTATTPRVRSVTVTERYAGQIQAQRHVKIRAPATEYLEATAVKPGQAVRDGDLMFEVRPVHHAAKVDAGNAEVKIAELEFDHARRQYESKLIPQQDVLRFEARLSRARAQLAAELSRGTVTAPFDGVVDRLYQKEGSLVEKGDTLTTLSDNSLMRVYFNVSEARYLEYMANPDREDLKIELELPDGSKFGQIGKFGAIDANFNNETGTIHFRADFPNPDRRLRHGQTGFVLISRVQPDAIVIPQRATFENFEKRYVYVVDKDDVAHQREIVVEQELEDEFVVAQGLGVDDKIVLDGILQVRDGEKIEYAVQ